MIYGKGKALIGESAKSIVNEVRPGRIMRPKALKAER
jgi:hypothetical protein